MNSTQQQPQRPQRPKLPSFGPYDSSIPSPKASPGALLYSCRTLQSIVTTPQQPARAQTRQNSNNRPTPLPSPSVSRCKLQSPAPMITPPPSSTVKRKRDDTDEDDTMDLDEAPGPVIMRDFFQTPKRQRRIPADLPLGLDASDFDALCTPDVPREQDQMECDEHMSMQDPADLQDCFSRHPQSLDASNARPPDDARQLFEPTLQNVQPLQA